MRLVSLNPPLSLRVRDKISVKRETWDSKSRLASLKVVKGSKGKRRDQVRKKGGDFTIALKSRPMRDGDPSVDLRSWSFFFGGGGGGGGGETASLTVDSSVS